MGSELIINATLPETRIALLEGGEIQELHIEREHSRGIVGNIYKGRVIRVLPGMQAAFVDIGLDKAAFLYVDDVYFPDMECPIEVGTGQSGQQNQDASDGGQRGQSDDSGAEGIDASGPEDDDELAPSVAQRKKDGETVNIQDLVKEGQEILVQVAKDPIGTKGARLTCHVSLAGRYLVFMPTVDHVGVSRRIESDSERRRLKQSILKYRPAQTGFIVRTASSTQDDAKIKADIEYLVKTWNEVRDKFRSTKSPNLVYQDYTIVIRAIRDMMTEEVDRLVVDSRYEHKQIMKFVQKFMPSAKSRIELYEKSTPIFDYFGIELEISRAMDRKVWLKSGGYLVIDQSEALVAIDVNTGRYVGKRNLEDTILRTNLEAVKEIAYQLRLRNCGGIIILDLIDMEKEANRERVYQALEDELKKDRARPTILKISQLGLVEMTRKRTRENIIRTLCEPCPYCEGRGFIKNKLTIAYDIMREIEREAFNRETESIVIECNPSVAQILGGDRGAILEDLQQRIAKDIVIKSVSKFHLEQYNVIANRGERAVPIKENKKDAQGLGDVESVTDAIEDQMRRRERSGIGPESEAEAIMSLPFVNSEKMDEDSDRELREERSSEKPRRNKRSGRSGKKSRDRERENENDQENDSDSSQSQEQASTSGAEVRPSIVVPLVQPRDKALVTPAAIVLPSDQPRTPRNYEEYMATSPEPGTELTRAEWESQNYHLKGRHHGHHRQQKGGRGDQRRRGRHRRGRRMKGRHGGNPRPQSRPNP